MYLRHTTRRKDGKVHRYWRLVRSVRVGRRVIQQTVAKATTVEEKQGLTEKFRQLRAAYASRFLELPDASPPRISATQGKTARAIIPAAIPARTSPLSRAERFRSITCRQVRSSVCRRRISREV